MNYRLLYITIVTLAGFELNVAAQEGAPGKAAPQLVVTITIDQLRGECIDAFMPYFSDGGFRRLMREGITFSNASYNFTPVDAASAVASVYTGTTPYYNKIIGRWRLDRKTLRPKSITLGDTPQGAADQESPALLCTSTIADELKIATHGQAKVVAIAPDSHEAIFAAGHAADAAFWIDEATGKWTSSDYYNCNADWVASYNLLNPLKSIIVNEEWQQHPSLNAAPPVEGLTAEGVPFCHKFTDSFSIQQYKSSGLINRHITKFALQCLASHTMGLDRQPDLLALTYYAGSMHGQDPAEHQAELRDTYVRLDLEIANLIAECEKKAGMGKMAVMVTGTGYTTQTWNDYAKFRVPTGEFNMPRTANILNMYYGAIWGQGGYVDATFGNQIFLNHKLLESRKISLAEASRRAQEFLATISGVRNVYSAQQLITDQNVHTMKVRNGMNAQLSGDIFVEIAPGWKLIDADDKQQAACNTIANFLFPVIIYGAGTRKQTVSTPVTTDRIASTLAKMLHIRAPNACTAEPLF